MNKIGQHSDRTVIVIGAGPVGQSAALLLARWGIPVVIVDSRPARDFSGSRAICQQRDVLDVWDSVGAGSQIAAEGVTWTTSRTFYGDDELITTTFRDKGQSPFPPFVNLSQNRTEQILDECIAKSPLIDMRWGHQTVGLKQHPNGVDVTCSVENGSVTISAAFAIAAPGSKGEAIRKQLGVSFDGKSFDDRFLICDIQTDIPGWQNERRFYFDPLWNPGRQVLIHPCPGGTFRIDWQVPPDFDLDEEVASGALDNRIRQIIGPRDYSLVWKSVYRFHSRIVNRMRVGRVLLAGDAAHLVAPFGARGLNSGVLDAENAAWKLAFILNGWAHENLIESYHIERHAAAMENLAVTTDTMDFLVPPNESARHRRYEILESAKCDMEARAKVDSGRLAEPFWYIDSPLTASDERREFPGRPERGDTPPPCPGVLVPDFPLTLSERPDIVRFRQLLREGITLLLGDDIKFDDIKTTFQQTQIPVNIYKLRDIELGSPVLDVLGARPDEVWIIRPDAHIAAITKLPLPTKLDEIIGPLLKLTIAAI